MSARAIQLRKEARQILWPWLAMTLTGAAALIYLSQSTSSWSPYDSLMSLFPLGFFLGIPVLAALPLGSEFHHGTLPVLLAQPVDRLTLWRQKWLITLAAVLPAAILYFLAGRVFWWEAGTDLKMAAAWMTATTAGAMTWTLIARSTMGGVVLSSGLYWILFFVWTYVSDHMPPNGRNSSIFHWTTGIFLLAYCIAMVLLSRRLFLRLQAAEGMLGREAVALVPRLRFLPQISFDWFRSRPRGAILNLLRREIQLLRVVWLLGLFSLAAWICLLAFRVVKPEDSWSENPAVLLTVLVSFLIALLAGALSLGEEKTRGTHSWHLTLPLSASWQWFAKLFVALFVSIVCAVGIPFGVLFARGWISGAPFSYLEGPPVWVWLLEALFTTLLAFWCSCAVKGTVRSVLYVFPMLFAIGLTFTFGNRLAYKIMEHVGEFLVAAVSGYDLFRLNRALNIVANPIDSFRVALSLVIAPILAIGLIQSLRMFRGWKEDRKFQIVRSALPPLATLFATCLALALVFLVAHRLGFQQEQVLHEANQAIQTLESSERMQAARVHHYKFEDLARAYPLSDRAKQWLRGSTIVVIVKAANQGDRHPQIQWPYEKGYVDLGSHGKFLRPYSATLHTAKGAECNLSFWTAGEGGLLTESCQ